MEQKANQTEVVESLDSKRDKNVSIFMNDLHTDVKEAMTGGSVAVVGEDTVGSENLKYKAVTPDKISFVRPNKNLFNKNTTTLNKNFTSTGVMVNVDGSQVSDYIYIKPSTAYAMSHARMVVFYDASNTLISALSYVSNFTTPANAYTARISVTDEQVNTMQLEEGMPTPYEPYTPFAEGVKPDLSKVAEQAITGNLIRNKEINKEHLNFLARGKNLFDKSKALADTNIINSTGATAQTSGVDATDYIEIDPEQSYTISHPRPVVFYGNNKNRLSHVLDPTTFETPPNAKYVRTTILARNLNSFQLEKGKIKTPYEPFRLITSGIEPDPEYAKTTMGSFDPFLKDYFDNKSKNELSLQGHTVCHIPTYDNTLSICHPSVIYKENGWGGYKYWMAYTPYPQSWEEPCVAASNDGITWEVPDGLVNPLFSNTDAKAIGYRMTSDTHILLSSDGTKLMVYFRTMYEHNNSGKGEGIHLATSTNGIDWVVTTDLISLQPTLNQDGTTEDTISIMSPAVEIVDGIYTMWSVNSNNSNINVVEKRTSNDGIIWTSPTQCILPDETGFIGYHIDVKEYAGIYYMLSLGNPGGLRLKFLSSPDGVTWTYVKNQTIPLSGLDWDKSSHYRSTFLLNSNGKFDLWLNGVKNGSGNAWAWDAQWRVAYYKDVDLLNGIVKTAPKTNVYYGTVADAPTATTGYINGDRYEYIDPVDYVGQIVVDGEWRNFGGII